MRRIQDFLPLLAVGGLLCGAVWGLARRRIRHSWLWRAPFCLLMAAFITPSAVKIGHSWALCPAVFVAPVMISETNDVRVGLLFGILPIFVAAGIIFSVWAMVLRGRSKAAPDDDASP